MRSPGRVSRTILRVRTVRTPWTLVIGLLLGCLMVSGCSVVFGATFNETESSGGDVDGDHWVVVSYETRNRSAVELMDALESTELRAAEALEAAGVGFIDGNEVGDDSYELYFNGKDAPAMWKVLEPVLAQAPTGWDRVELRDGLEDPHPTVIRR